MSDISIASNKNGTYKSHIVPAVVTAALALAAAIPLTAAFASQARPVSADVVPVSVGKVADNACGTTTSQAAGSVQGASTVSHTYPTPGAVNSQGNSHGSGNGNGSGANANGNTQTNVGGLIGGVNANLAVSALNGSLNDVLSDNNVLNGNNVSVPVLNDVLSPLSTLHL